MLSIIDVVEKKGVKKGFEAGIQGFVEAFQEEGFNSEKIAIRLSDKFELSIEEAEEYVKKYWK